MVGLDIIDQSTGEDNEAGLEAGVEGGESGLGTAN